MRLNKYLAHVTDLSRRGADDAIDNGAVLINGKKAELGTSLYEGDTVVYKGKTYTYTEKIVEKAPLVILLNKPVGYVCSRDGQGAPTVYDLLPNELKMLKIAGRLDKDSSGLVLLTDDGYLLNRLTHPSYNKLKTYEITLNKPLRPDELKKITIEGVRIGDPRLSIFKLSKQPNSDTGREWVAQLEEGRNRQIRRTFEALGIEVKKLHRVKLANYELSTIAPGKYTEVI